MNDIKTYIDKSILCWLATSSSENIPNVSPKEIFAHYRENNIIIANIASPQSVKNIKENHNVCVSFIDVLVQKGYQIKGKAEIVSKNDTEYVTMETILLKMTKGKFPFSNIIKISIDNVKKIIAPKYILYPETTEEDQIESAKKAYGLQ
ncbi:pyridoxamine 5'-phosphate oxidase family protein [Flavivirga amylovorans]|uniref:Pyridoxamine 5'-phosphate oxidase family protein n=1 Tax=Flavivirga amylovorans TaxID=870486 RepID=A0ABT8WZE3_9FLAO|nr:pyridoxamine 5'-phosphate oxidase family protein [Flavivirga amylovorans]MDO5987048.1 pyridoxamine 5'-phosphate oxidase family protein [Flavivirga amylovorans]